MHIQDLMAGIYYSLVLFVDSWIFKSDRDQMDELLFPIVAKFKAGTL